jgi:2-haloacid dehalogenase
MQTEINRREFVGLATGALAASFIGCSALSAPPTTTRVQALAFDAFPIFDPRTVFTLAEELFPGKGAELSQAWRARQFEYTWLRTIAGSYIDFWHVTEDALVFAAKSLKLDLDSQQRAQLMNAYLDLKPWPDVPQALKSLKASGLRLAFLSNFTVQMLEAGIKNSALGGIFEHVLSTDSVKQFKPAPRAYQLGIDSLQLKKEEILFVAFAGWDAAGAKLFGYPTFWMNRQKLPMEELGPTPDRIGESMKDLLEFLK